MNRIFVFERLINRTFERHVFRDRQNAIRCALKEVKRAQINDKQKHEIMRQLETWGSAGPVGTFKDAKDEGIHYNPGTGTFVFNLYQAKIED